MGVDTGSDLARGREDRDFGHTCGSTGCELKQGEHEHLEAIVAFTFLYTFIKL